MAVMKAVGRRELLVLQFRAPPRKLIEEKSGFADAGIGVLSTCAVA
jgi:hypothetical protein